MTVDRLQDERDRARSACNICERPWPTHHKSCVYLDTARRAEAAEAEVARLRDALELAHAGLPDPMHPQIPKRFVDGLVCAQIVMNAALGHDDPGNVESATTFLAARLSVEPDEQGDT